MVRAVAVAAQPERRKAAVARFQRQHAVL